MSQKTAHYLNAIFLLAIWIISFILWSKLPASIPVHFGLSGHPDRWVTKSLSSWLLLPLVAIGMTIFMYGLSNLLSRLIHRYPKLLNIPKKEIFLAQPLEKKEPIFRLIEGLVYWMCVPLNAMWLSGQIGNYQVAIGASDRLPKHTLAMLWGSVVVELIILGIFLIHLNKLMNKL